MKPTRAIAALVALLVLVVACSSASTSTIPSPTTAPTTTTTSTTTSSNATTSSTGGSNPRITFPSPTTATTTGATNSGPRTLLVGAQHGRTGDFATIQAAVDAARPGDWILIGPGDYHERPAEQEAVKITTPDIHLRGTDRNSVVIDGTRPGSATVCSSDQADQNFGPDGKGRNGIVVDKVSGVTIENLTVCNFVGSGDANRYGNQIWFDGGAGSGTTGLGAYAIASVTVTSTYAPAHTGAPSTSPIAGAIPAAPPSGPAVVITRGSGTPPPSTPPGPSGPTSTTFAGDGLARTGILISNATGPGTVQDSFGSNMADSAFHIAGCPDCNASFTNDTGVHNIIGFSATDAGGRLVVTNNSFTDNRSGVNVASENNEDAPPPQDGSCPQGITGTESAAPQLCTVIADNTIQSNNATDVPGADGGGAEVFQGVGIGLVGAHNDLVTRNRVQHQSAYGIITTVSDIGSGANPGAQCQGGQQLTTSVCFFSAYGNVITANTVSSNGGYGNPTNGDLADATLSHDPGNCFSANVNPTGPVRTAPDALQNPDGGCRGASGGAVFGPLGVQVACATNALGPCTDNTGHDIVPALGALATLLHADASFDATALSSTPATYPAATPPTAPMSPAQSSLAVPCRSTPANPWCPAQ